MEQFPQGTRVKIIDGKHNFLNVVGTIVGCVVTEYPYCYIIKPDDETLDFATGFDDPYNYTHVHSYHDCIELI